MQTTKFRFIPILLMLMLAASLVACDNDSSDVPVDPNTQSTLQGVWEQRGYGRAFDIAGNTVTVFDFTTRTCVIADSENLGEFVAMLDHVSADAEEFTLRDAPIGFVTRYSKIDSLPATCLAPIGARPTEIFEHICHTFNEYYAFFEERGTDWLAQYDAIRDRIHDGLSEAEFFALLSELIGPIDDVHVSISAPDGTTFTPGRPKGFYRDFLEEFEQQTDLPSAEEYFAQELNTALAIVDSVYLDGAFVEAGGPSDDFFKWGLIGDDIGYLNVGAFILGFDRPIADQLAEVEAIIDRVLADLSATQALIIDVRLSPGGADPIALAVANRFADRERVAIRKTTRATGSPGLVEEVSVMPSARIRYRNPAVVLTSGFSASATETFILAMRALPQVRFVGERTVGALSDILEKPLPNGWQVNLANEVYFDAAGIAYEAVGIPPDIEVPAFGSRERRIGQDSALNAALKQLGVVTE